MIVLFQSFLIFVFYFIWANSFIQLGIKVKPVTPNFPQGNELILGLLLIPTLAYPLRILEPP